MRTCCRDSKRTMKLHDLFVLIWPKRQSAATGDYLLIHPHHYGLYTKVANSVAGNAVTVKYLTTPTPTIEPTHIVAFPRGIAASLHHLEDGSSTHSPVGGLCGANSGANSNIDELETAPLGLKDGFTVCKGCSQRPVRLNDDQTHSYDLFENFCSKTLYFIATVTHLTWISQLKLQSTSLTNNDISPFHRSFSG